MWLVSSTTTSESAPLAGISTPVSATSMSFTITRLRRHGVSATVTDARMNASPVGSVVSKVKSLFRSPPDRRRSAPDRAARSSPKSPTVWAPAHQCPSRCGRESCSRFRGDELYVRNVAAVDRDSAQWPCPGCPGILRRRMYPLPGGRPVTVNFPSGRVCAGVTS